MRSKVASRIQSKTKEQVRQSVRDYTDIIVKTQELIDLHNSFDDNFMVDQYVSLRDRFEELKNKQLMAIDNPYHRFIGSRYFYLWTWYIKKRMRHKSKQLHEVQLELDKMLTNRDKYK
jgi:hypothetical protein